MKSIRKFTGLLAALAALGVAILAAQPASASHGGDAPRTGGAHASVVGGSPATIEEFPSLAYIEGGLEEGAFSFACTGTVIAPRVVLTAGHCVEDLELEVLERPAGYAVATGVANHRDIPKQNISGVSRLLVYPGLDPRFIHGDAGLLILKRPTTATPIALAGSGDGALLAAGTPIEIAGWGLADFRREDGPALLQKGSLTVQPTARCRGGGTALHHHFSPALQLCALDAPGFHMSGCFGDSGGPAIAHRPDGSQVQIGIISSGGFECETREPHLYTRVDQVSTWAGEWVAAVETGAPAPPVEPLPPALMHQIEAEFLTIRALGEDFVNKGRRDFEESIATSCTRATRSRYRCRVHWNRGGGRYYGVVQVFYTPHVQRLTWNDGYTIHRVSESCLRSRPAAKCPVHTRTRHPGKPKNV